ncbi:hypothetical protein Trco_008521 [Trichoderma cornu-damae]|uniref:Uncharacterized protein n=1 Tax=Trichoderma cornu-damae TaxID=654480 RepID=A0A9P8QIS7_9HYPO|nr:hypothetical protein Trco_008521 [Trichoderma cornu-damae]
MEFGACAGSQPGGGGGPSPRHVIGKRRGLRLDDRNGRRRAPGPGRRRAVVELPMVLELETGGGRKWRADDAADRDATGELCGQRKGPRESGGAAWKEEELRAEAWEIAHASGREGSCWPGNESWSEKLSSSTHW